MARLAFGDVIEVPTPNGVAYAQYINKHRKYGALLRVFCGTYDQPLDDLSGVVEGDVQFMCFFPLQAAIREKIVRQVGNSPVPPDAKEFPVFRAGVVDPATGKVAVWWLWDGDKEWRVDELDPEQRKLPIRGVWNDTILVERILSGWRPETDPTT